MKYPPNAVDNPEILYKVDKFYRIAPDGRLIAYRLIVSSSRLKSVWPGRFNRLSYTEYKVVWKKREIKNTWKWWASHGHFLFINFWHAHAYQMQLRNKADLYR